MFKEFFIYLKNYSLKVKWSNEVGISLDTHSDYIKKFAETFYEQVKLLIDRNHADHSAKNEFYYTSKADSNLIQEILDHAAFCNETAEKFHGREDLLLQVTSNRSLNYKLIMLIFFFLIR